jgi:hypothetical protein
MMVASGMVWHKANANALPAQQNKNQPPSAGFAASPP